MHFAANFATMKTRPCCFGIGDITVLYTDADDDSPTHRLLPHAWALCSMLYMNYEKNPHGNPWVVPIIAPILQMETLRLRNFKYFVSGHTAKKKLACTKHMLLILCYTLLQTIV